jgi:hypothetical protein
MIKLISFIMFVAVFFTLLYHFFNELKMGNNIVASDLILGFLVLFMLRGSVYDLIQEIKNNS